MRSSAVGEDAELSHAGQYLTVLNVRRDGIVHAYKRVVASLFSPWALSYRFQKGVRDEDLTMGVACLQMIDPVTSGVAFSRHPFRGFEDVAIINAVWGLGLFAVSGKVTPDLYTVARDESLAIVQSRISSKPLKLITSPEGGIKETEVPEEQQDVRCLSPEQVRHLAQCAIDLETHYGSPQDVEWAIDREDRVWILQSRPLRITATPGKEVTGDNAQLGDFPLLLEGGAVAFPGIGSGPIFHVEGEEDLKSFPEGAVLVARHPSPRFVTAMRTAQAIITDTGSPLGHMASLSREFQVPTLLGTRVATSSLKEGMVVTVDAHSGRVYEGRVEALIDRQAAVIPYMKDTPASAALARVADLIVPLRLINPRSPSFSAAACRSLHDIMRFVHESSYAAMFKLSDLLSNSEGGAVKLKAPIPLDLYVIDLGGGMAEDRRSQRSVTAAEVKSVPFQALLQGMMRPEVQIHHRSRPIEVRGLLSVMSEQMLTPPGSGGERFGDRSYAIISDRYLHFSSRIGYHYSILDSYCDEQTRKSYITFSFQGGAADETRRGRRARAITLVLKAHGFTVDNKADRVDSRLRRAEMSVLLEKLDMIGRLLQFTRQLDMLMFNEKSVQAAATAFLEGRYQLDGMA